MKHAFVSKPIALALALLGLAMVGLHVNADIVGGCCYNSDCTGCSGISVSAAGNHPTGGNGCASIVQTGSGKIKKTCTDNSCNSCKPVLGSGCIHQSQSSRACDTRQFVLMAAAAFVPYDR